MSTVTKLSSGTTIPNLGFGTGTVLTKRNANSDQEVIDSVARALKAGFKHIDAAEFYENEKEVGLGIKKSGVDRSEFFLTTKLSKTFDDPEGNLDRALKDLQTDYVDLYLIHHSLFVKEGKHTIAEIWKALEAIAEKGKAKAIGVSNFSVGDLKEVLAVAKIKPAALQIEFHPYLQNQTPGIIDFAKSNGIAIESYGGLTPLTTAKDGPLTPVVERIAKKYGKTTTQVILRWVQQYGVISVTTSNKESRLKEILDIYSFELTTEEFDEISKVGNSYHFHKFTSIVDLERK